MRVALLSTLEPAEDAGIPCGLLRVGGRAVLEHQLGVALACGCERVLCLADATPGELMTIQYEAESAGLAFRVVANGHEIAAIIGPGDDLLVLSGGFFAPAGAAVQLLAEGPVVLVQSADVGLPAGFERIDLNHADAGALRLPGRLVARLVELPRDWSAPSALLRIAVQAGVPQKELPVSVASSGCWALIRSEAAAQQVEPHWLRMQMANSASRSPGAWLAVQLVQKTGPAILRTRTRPPPIAAAAALIALAGAGLGWAGWSPAAFLLLGLAWLTQQGAQLLAGLTHGLVRRRARIEPSVAFALALDGLFVLCCLIRLSQPGPYAIATVPATFVALVLFGMVHLIPRLFPGKRWTFWFDDRLVAGLLLAAASATQVFAPVVMAASLLMIGYALAFVPPRDARPGANRSAGSG